MREALRGKAIERYARELVQKEPGLMGRVELGKVNRGPDLKLKDSDEWFDWTTEKQWSSHELRGYPGQGHLLDTTKR